VILQISAGGGLFVRRPARPPTLVLYTDGRLVTVDPGQSRSLPQLSVRQVTVAGRQAVVAAALKAGLDTAYDEPTTPDATTTTVTFATGGRASVSSFSSGAAGGGPDAAVRQRILAFVNDIRSNPGSITGTTELGPPRPLPVERLALLVTPEPGPGSAGRVRSWAAVGPDRRPLTLSTVCTVIAGRAAAVVASALRGADPLWRSGGQRWRITASPLVPGQSEKSC
jgi:hypothetical protein